MKFLIEFLPLEPALYNNDCYSISDYPGDVCGGRF